MGHRTIGGIFRKSLSPACLAVAVSLFLPALLACHAAAADLTVSSKTYGLLYERERVGGQKDRYAPLYEYLSADAARAASAERSSARDWYSETMRRWASTRTSATNFDLDAISPRFRAQHFEGLRHRARTTRATWT